MLYGFERQRWRRLQLYDCQYEAKQREGVDAEAEESKSDEGATLPFRPRPRLAVATEVPAHLLRPPIWVTLAFFWNDRAVYRGDCTRTLRWVRCGEAPVIGRLCVGAPDAGH
jgi:hypothetical protein